MQPPVSDPGCSERMRNYHVADFPQVTTHVAPFGSSGRLSRVRDDAIGRKADVAIWGDGRR